jgi:hypothetical protein
VYRVTTDVESAEQVSALPAEAFVDYIAVVGVLELVPWNGQPYSDAADATGSSDHDWHQ